MAAARREDRAAELHERYGVQVTDAAAAAKMADTLVLAVKPQDMGRLLDEIAPVVPAGTLVISVAAGITTAFISRRLPGQLPVVRVMSNTPVLVDEAMSVISPGAHAREEHLRWDERLTGYDFGPGHPLAPVRVELTIALAREFGLLDRPDVTVTTPVPAEMTELELLHDAGYIDAVRQAGQDGLPNGRYGLGTPD